jgi:hypothetical protein
MTNLLCCKQGMIALSSARAAELLEMAKHSDVTVTHNDGFLLPSCRNEDILLRQPPLAFHLENKELIELTRRGNFWPVAATCYGPPQDKSRNEDAALSAVISSGGGGKYAFAAVADGVSTRTFWPERASKLACLAAYKTVRNLIVNENIFIVPDFALIIRDMLSQSIKNALLKDKEAVLSSNVTPPDWSPDLYFSNICRDDLWYNSTLLVSCLGNEVGVVFWLGDGGVRIIKSVGGFSNNSRAATHLQSTDSLEISSYVSLQNEIQFSGGAINFDGFSNIQVFLATDGVDRTLQRNGEIAYENLKLEKSLLACATLKEVWSMPCAEVDNYSIARICWPIGLEKPHNPRMCFHSSSVASLAYRPPLRL